MKQRQFRLLIWLILLMGCFFYQKIHHLEIDHEIIINNIATVDSHVLENTDSLTSIYWRVVDTNFMLKNL